MPQTRKELSFGQRLLLVLLSPVIGAAAMAALVSVAAGAGGLAQHGLAIGDAVGAAGLAWPVVVLAATAGAAVGGFISLVLLIMYGIEWALRRSSR